MTNIENPGHTEESSEGFRNADESGDDITEDIGHEEMMQKISELKTSLKQINKALKYIEEGTYGIDEKTKEPISLERLQIYPEATTNP